MNLSGRTQPLAQYSIEQALRVIAQAGFCGAEICLENVDIAPETLTYKNADRVRETCHALNLLPCSVSYHKDYIYNDDVLAHTIRSIEYTPPFRIWNFRILGRCEANARRV